MNGQSVGPLKNSGLADLKAQQTWFKNNYLIGSHTWYLNKWKRI